MSNSLKVYVNVSFDEKEIAKERGARYDPNIKKWYFVTSDDKLHYNFKGFEVIKTNVNNLLPTFEQLVEHKKQFVKKTYDPFDEQEENEKQLNETNKYKKTFIDHKKKQFIDDDCDEYKRPLRIPIIKFNRMYGNKHYLCVPYDYKDDVKKLGAKWDNEIKKWYVETNNPNYQHLVDIYHPENYKHVDDKTLLNNEIVTEKERQEIENIKNQRWSKNC
jgi:hypothetical protein